MSGVGGHVPASGTGGGHEPGDGGPVLVEHRGSAIFLEALRAQQYGRSPGDLHSPKELESLPALAWTAPGGTEIELDAGTEQEIQNAVFIMQAVHLTNPQQ